MEPHAASVTSVCVKASSARLHPHAHTHTHRHYTRYTPSARSLCHRDPCDRWREVWNLFSASCGDAGQRQGLTRELKAHSGAQSWDGAEERGRD